MSHSCNSKKTKEISVYFMRIELNGAWNLSFHLVQCMAKVAGRNFIEDRNFFLIDSFNLIRRVVPYNSSYLWSSLNIYAFNRREAINRFPVQAIGNLWAHFKRNLIDLMTKTFWTNFNLWTPQFLCSLNLYDFDFRWCIEFRKHIIHYAETVSPECGWRACMKNAVTSIKL